MKNIYKAKNGLEINLDYKAEVVRENVDPNRISEYTERNTFFTGTDAAAVMGASHYNTLRDVILAKRGHKKEESKYTQFMFSFGHVNEELVKDGYVMITGNRCWDTRSMYRHPLFPFMGANPDFFVEQIDSNGKKTIGILDSKTSNPMYSHLKYGTEEEPIIPPDYEWQMRHYMAVLNLNYAIICCGGTNSLDDLIIRRIERDLELEAELIQAEKEAWEEYMEANTLPPYTEKAKLITESVSNNAKLPVNTEFSKINENDLLINGNVIMGSYKDVIAEIDELSRQKAELKKQEDALEEMINGKKSIIKDSLRCNAIIVCPEREKDVKIEYKSATKLSSLSTKEMRTLLNDNPDMYKKYVQEGVIKESEAVTIRFTDVKKAAI